jgi:hypothetical protein
MVAAEKSTPTRSRSDMAIVFMGYGSVLSIQRWGEIGFAHASGLPSRGNTA